jgi:hypothetical protein
MKFAKTSRLLFGMLALSAFLAMHGRAQSSTAIRSGFDQQALSANDDGSTDIVPLGFLMNFYGNLNTTLYVNNNGNVTFDSPQSEYTPKPLSGLGSEVIAPFWADVDTRHADSDVVKYGTNTVNGCEAFGVDWVNVGYYTMHADLLLSCQLVIVNRFDIAPGDFDMEFNYEKVQWQWGDVTTGVPPRAGFASSSASYELPGSGVTGAFLDTNTETSLIYNSANSSVNGRYVFFFRGGTLVPEPTSITLVGVGLMVMGGGFNEKAWFHSCKAQKPPGQKSETGIKPLKHCRQRGAPLCLRGGGR